jgi:hypothetical protein
MPSVIGHWSLVIGHSSFVIGHGAWGISNTHLLTPSSLHLFISSPLLPCSPAPTPQPPFPSMIYPETAILIRLTCVLDNTKNNESALGS